MPEVRSAGLAHLKERIVQHLQVFSTQLRPERVWVHLHKVVGIPRA